MSTRALTRKVFRPAVGDSAVGRVLECSKCGWGVAHNQAPAPALPIWAVTLPTTWKPGHAKTSTAPRAYIVLIEQNRTSIGSASTRGGY